ncbi:hypothetical protein FUAX_51270 (plasmid) [Fulvitalea axinellae]|uniref:Aquaporin family protein n=1 Tax=Fulvitalea axinellae TaxID=1182444 RepID=A0AAU9CU87_9BACT|nr:hypothetical protein FUAX_51270 [Fulvitalea axinellae]
MRTKHLVATLGANYKMYLMEAFGLAIFMVSACFCWALIASDQSPISALFVSDFSKLATMGVAMGLTALFIFYSPWTSPSGAHINPAVTLVFYRLGQINTVDTVFYILFQFLGGTLAVYLMKVLMNGMLTEPAINYVVTVPGEYGVLGALLMEFSIAFVMITMVLYTSGHPKLQRFTKVFAGVLVCTYVVVSGPISGFGMNPARSFASALPAHTWTAFWIYIIVPIAGMLTAAEVHLLSKKKEKNAKV